MTYAGVIAVEEGVVLNDVRISQECGDAVCFVYGSLFGCLVQPIILTDPLLHGFLHLIHNH